MRRSILIDCCLLLIQAIIHFSIHEGEWYWLAARPRFGGWPSPSGFHNFSKAVFAFKLKKLGLSLKFAKWRSVQIDSCCRDTQSGASGLRRSDLSTPQPVVC